MTRFALRKPILTALSDPVHASVGLDKRRDPRRIARVIADSGAQIVGLQEVHSEPNGADELHQMNFLAGVTGLQAVPGPPSKGETAITATCC